MYNQPQNQIQNKPTAAYWVSLIGGVLGLLSSLAFLAFGALAYAAYTEAVSSYYGYVYGYESMFGWGYATLIGFGAWMLITSILVIVFAGKLKANPMEHTKWGILIIVFSLIGVGGLLGLIGGILALVYKPQTYGSAPYGQPVPPPQAYGASYAPQPPQQQAWGQQSQPITRICTQCGRVLKDDTKFCPSCGKQLG